MTVNTECRPMNAILARPHLRVMPVYASDQLALIVEGELDINTGMAFEHALMQLEGMQAEGARDRLLAAAVRGSDRRARCLLRPAAGAAGGPRAARRAVRRRRPPVRHRPPPLHDQCCVVRIAAPALSEHSRAGDPPVQYRGATPWSCSTPSDVRLLLAVSAGAPLGGCDQLRQRNVERGRDPKQVRVGGVSLAALDRRVIGAVHLASRGEFFL
jgi:hypothetical protein